MIENGSAIDTIICKNCILLTPDDIAPVLGTTPQTIRETARKAPELIGYPFTFNGKSMKIPKRPFLAFLGIETKAV